MNESGLYPAHGSAGEAGGWLALLAKALNSNLDGLVWAAPLVPLAALWSGWLAAVAHPWQSLLPQINPSFRSACNGAEGGWKLVRPFVDDEKMWLFPPAEDTQAPLTTVARFNACRQQVEALAWNYSGWIIDPAELDYWAGRADPQYTLLVCPTGKN